MTFNWPLLKYSAYIWPFYDLTEWSIPLKVNIIKEHPIRNGLKGTMVTNTIRNRHLESSRHNLSQMSQRKLSSIEQREANHDDQIIV